MNQQCVTIHSAMKIWQKKIVIGIVRFVKRVAIGENGIVMDVINVCYFLTIIFVRMELNDEFILGAYGTNFPCPRCERKERMFSFW